MGNRARRKQGITSPYVEVLYPSKERIKDVPEKAKAIITPREKIKVLRRNRESETRCQFSEKPRKE